MEYVTCEHCGNQLPKAEAIVEPEFGRAWHVAHYGKQPVAARRRRFLRSR